MNALHGTLQGYVQHRRAGQPPCQACRRAAADAIRATSVPRQRRGAAT